MKDKLNLAIVLIALIGIIIIAGCAQQEKLKTDDQEVQIIYSIGSGWTGWRETLTINNDGSINFEEEQPLVDENKTIKSMQLSDEELQEIKALILDSDVFNYKDRYDCEPGCPTDMPGSSIKFIIDGNEKTVSMYAPTDLPESLKQILGKIKSIEEKFR